MAHAVAATVVKNTGMEPSSAGDANELRTEAPAAPVAAAAATVTPAAPTARAPFEAACATASSSGMILQVTPRVEAKSDAKC
mmetsp:Transcript_129331/g.322407  ORF Transcript_129331/g.322407 Transcript_129331/m.322407 type:complete len:82 (-) Transcript_129331:662-907(-)